MHVKLFVLVLLASAIVSAQTSTHSSEVDYNGVLTGVDTSQLKAWTNGNDWGHISRENVHTLFPGFTGGILARYMPWWCNSGHTMGYTPSSNYWKAVGYCGNVQADVDKILDEMAARGFDGTTVADAFSNTDNESNTILFWDRLKARMPSSFKLALTVNKGEFTGVSGSSARKQKLIDDICNKFNPDYFQDPTDHYLKYDLIGDNKGWRSVLFFFDWAETSDSLGILQADLQAAWDSTRGCGDSIWIFRNGSGFDYPVPSSGSEGAFAWLNADFVASDPYGITWLDDHFFNALHAHTEDNLVVVSAYKGFDDSEASWGDPGVDMPQDCGKAYWAVIDKTNSEMNPADPDQKPDYVHFVTWNDYQEGTAIEPGIKNCTTVSGSTTIDHLDFAPAYTGNDQALQRNIAKFRVFISPDGEQLPYQKDYAVTAQSADLMADFSAVPDGEYDIYVKAVGQPNFHDSMSPAIRYTKTSCAECAVIVTPRNGETVQGMTVPIRAYGKVSAGPAKQMQLWVDGVKQPVYNNVDHFETSYTFGASGAHAIHVSIYDFNWVKVGEKDITINLQ